LEKRLVNKAKKTFWLLHSYHLPFPRFLNCLLWVQYSTVLLCIQIIYMPTFYIFTVLSLVFLSFVTQREVNGDSDRMGTGGIDKTSLVLPWIINDSKAFLHLEYTKQIFIISFCHLQVTWRKCILFFVMHTTINCNAWHIC
jgi:hypothetical protein